MKKYLATIVAMMIGLTSLAGNQIAIQIVMDDSGSMKDGVSGVKGSKYDAGLIALGNISRQIEDFVTKNPSDDVKVGLITFEEDRASIIKPLTTYNKKAFEAAVKALPGPHCNTPLGEAIASAYAGMPNDTTTKKHIFVITDGEQNGKLKMERIIGSNKGKAGVYFIAFDVNASVFRASKEQGAMVTQADNATQLFAEVSKIFGTKILPEKEE